MWFFLVNRLIKTENMPCCFDDFEDVDDFDDFGNLGLMIILYFRSSIEAAVTLG